MCKTKIAIASILYNYYMRISFLVTLGAVFLPVITQAASLYLDPPFADVYRSDAIVTSIRLDVDKATNECVNVFDIVVNYNGALTPVDISLGQSFVPLWVEAPVIDREAQTISMAGGIPNGYCGRVAGDSNLTNVIADIIFRLAGNEIIDSDVSIVSFSPNSKLYLNDGRGTAAPLRTFQAEYTLFDEVGEEIRDDWTATILADTIPPEPFEITLHDGDLATGGQYFIEFNTTDKQSGLSHYQVIEERDVENSFFTFGAATTPWVDARSPYILKDQTLRSLVRVKAIDKAGNEYVATLLPRNTGLLPLEWFGFGLAVFAVVSLIGFVIVYVLRRRREKHSPTVFPNQLNE